VSIECARCLKHLSSAGLVLEMWAGSGFPCDSLLSFVVVFGVAVDNALIVVVGSLLLAICK
jgi:hypothetical protein